MRGDFPMPGFGDIHAGTIDDIYAPVCFGTIHAGIVTVQHQASRGAS